MRWIPGSRSAGRSLALSSGSGGTFRQPRGSKDMMRKISVRFGRPPLRSPSGVRLLAVALAVSALGAPWIASKGDCREAECQKRSVRQFSAPVFPGPDAAPCPCPESCETEQAGACARSFDRVREANSGRQERRNRQQAPERGASSAVWGVDAGDVPPASSPLVVAWRPPPPSHPLYLRHRSIVR